MRPNSFLNVVIFHFPTFTIQKYTINCHAMRQKFHKVATSVLKFILEWIWASAEYSQSFWLPDCSRLINPLVSNYSQEETREELPKHQAIKAANVFTGNPKDPYPLPHGNILSMYPLKTVLFCHLGWFVPNAMRVFLTDGRNYEEEALDMQSRFPELRCCAETKYDHVSILVLTPRSWCWETSGYSNAMVLGKKYGGSKHSGEAS
jgi:hypothetical protein